jgi:hypothetical protein
LSSVQQKPKPDSEFTVGPFTCYCVKFEFLKILVLDA